MPLTETIPINGQAATIEETQEIQVFENSGLGRIRATMIDGIPWWIAADVCTILGHSNVTIALGRIDDDEKSKLNLGLSGGATNCVNEYGLYSLILGSRKPQAKEFKRWITHEVVPSIRKYGLYATDELLNNPDLAIKAFETIKEERERRIIAEQKNEMLESKIEMDKPKVNFAEALLDTETCIPALDLAKILNQNGIDIGQHRLYRWMRENGYFIKKGDSKNLPTQKAMNLGLFKISEKTWFNNSTLQYEISRKTLVTPKGQMYFVDLFASGKAKYD